MAKTINELPEAAATQESKPKDEVKSARSRAEELMSHTRDGKLVAEIFGETLNKQYLIYGKSMNQWRQQFHLKIPESPDTAQCGMLASKLASMFHEATFFHSLAEAQYDALNSGEFREYTKAFETEVAKFKAKFPNKSLPAHKTLETQANSRMLDLKGAINNARIAKNFFKRILEGLTEVRKNLEIVTRNNYIQLKLEPRTNIPSTPDRGGYGRRND